jgi:phosphoribosylformylglycinamidine cyclo-ligase
VHGIAHVTGGGLQENVARVLPEHAEAVVQRSSWPVPPVFRWLARLGEIDQAEMDRVFNLGVGMILIVSPYYAESIRQQLKRAGCENWQIGWIREGRRGVAWAETAG